MRVHLLAGAVLAGLVAGCSQSPTSDSHLAVTSTASPALLQPFAAGAHHSSLSRIASLPDRGTLVAYERADRPIQRGAYTVRPVQLSEERALRAIGEEGMVFNTPEGGAIRLAYERHYEHPDGSWTWVGRPVGAPPGADAVLTFGDKAVFGSIPNGDGAPLQVTTSGGRTWVVETDRRKEAALAAQSATPMSDDAIAAPAIGTSHAVGHASAPKVASAAISATTAAAAPATTAVVDLVMGYTNAFASRWGGQSQVMTRLNFLVDIANQAYANTQVNGRLRLVKAVQVTYPDNTSNRSALLQLSAVTCSTSNSPNLHLPDGGVACNSATRPAALQPLIDAREQVGADLVVLVRNFVSPDNGSCGLGWELGGGQTPIDASSAEFAMSVISDSGGTEFPSNNATCRNDILAHETGHNLGLQHDMASAAGSDDSNNDGNLLDPDEYGRFPYSFGYSTSSFYTVMSQIGANQRGYLVFSNPRITFCGGVACGIVDQADNARTLEQTMPIVAAFRTSRLARNDFDGDGTSDILWRNTSSGADAVWLSANAATQQATSGVSTTWKAVGTGDFDGDGESDILWRNSATGTNSIWRSGNSTTSMVVARVANLSWVVAGVGDFDGDGQADILWRNKDTGADTIWRSGNAATTIAVASAAPSWKIVGVGDFDADGHSDILWRNSTTGSNAIWRSGNLNTPTAVARVANLSYVVAGVGDFDGDGRADILWRNMSSGTNSIWKHADASTAQSVVTVALAWKVASVSDYNGDGIADILWRNSSTGANTIWRSANFATSQAVTGVSNKAWTVVP